MCLLFLSHSACMKKIVKQKSLIEKSCQKVVNNFLLKKWVNFLSKINI
jgi:hypothetical protein